MITKLRLVLILLSISFVSFAQNSQKATLAVKAEYVKSIPSLAEQIKNGEFIEAVPINKEVNIKRRDANVTVPGKGLPYGNDPLWKNQQNTRTTLQDNEPIITFEVASASVTPTDPTGAVGPNHFVNSWNSAFRIWDKEGNPLTNSASLATIFPGETLGDPIVVYDRYAERFVIMEFSNSPNGILVAVCQGEDPVNDGWFTYRFNMNSFPDYPKLTIWSDGYYITANKNSSSAGTTEVVYALERDKMIIGEEDAQMHGFPLPQITTSGFFSPLGFNVNGSELPPVGNAPIVYVQDDAWGGVSTDHLKIWNINVDWADENNSEISSPQVLETAAFDGVFDGGSFSNLPQPSGQDIDALQATIMYMAQYRRFSSYNAVVLNFVVDLDGSDDLAGIRWYELRQDNDGDEWTIFQEGTYAQPDGHSAFAGNMAMDVNGNIGLAYTVVSDEVYPSLRYTGRLNGDPSGVMTFNEQSIAEGTMSNPSYRYGDYSQMTVDPSDDVTFWSIGEYFKDGARKNHVGAFMLAPSYENDIAVISINEPESGVLTNAEQISVTLRNFGSETISDLTLKYSINGGAEVEEVFAGPLLSYESVDFTFAQTVDMSTLGEEYEIVVTAVLAEDEQLDNNELSKTVMYLYPIDVGIVDILSPVSGEGLSDEEPIIALVKNFGTDLITVNFNLSFMVDNGSTVFEQFTTDLDAGEEAEFEFSNTGDFSAVGDHTIRVSTSLSADMNEDNDDFEKVITTEMCAPESNCGSGSGIKGIWIGDLENISNCSEDGYGDYTDMSTTLFKGYTHDLIIAGHQGDQFASVWIDYNDNFLFEAEEQLINNASLSPGLGSGVYFDTLDLSIADDVVLGEHLMRVKVSWVYVIPDNSCEGMSWGETEDYTLNIDFDESVDSPLSKTGDLVVYNTGNNQFRATMESAEMSDVIFVTVHDILGRKVIQNRVHNVGGIYQFEFDMSYAQEGMYLVRFGNHEFGKVEKIVVK